MVFELRVQVWVREGLEIIVQSLAGQIESPAICLSLFEGVYSRR
jgi:hypothetical protein